MTKKAPQSNETGSERSPDDFTQLTAAPPYRLEEAKRLIPINSYLLSKNTKLHHIPALRVFAKGVTLATKERWDEIFRDY